MGCLIVKCAIFNWEIIEFGGHFIMSLESCEQ